MSGVGAVHSEGSPVASSTVASAVAAVTTTLANLATSMPSQLYSVGGSSGSSTSISSTATATTTTAAVESSSSSWMPIGVIAVVGLALAAKQYHSRSATSYSPGALGPTRKGGYRTVDSGMAGVDCMDDDVSWSDDEVDEGTARGDSKPLEALSGGRSKRGGYGASGTGAAAPRAVGRSGGAGRQAHDDDCIDLDML